MKKMKIVCSAIVLEALTHYIRDRRQISAVLPFGKSFDPDGFLLDFGIWLANEHKRAPK
jgi:hypothetical protein